MANIAFIGVGHMGGPMAANLLKAGHTLTVYDVAASLMQPFVAKGAKAATTLKAAIAHADYVVSMLPAGQHVREVYLGEEGLLANATKPLVYIECSTIDVTTAKAIHTAIEHKGGVCVDAPVSGGTASAEAGTLTFMVGGSDSAHHR